MKVEFIIMQPVDTESDPEVQRWLDGCAAKLNAALPSDKELDKAKMDLLMYGVTAVFIKD